MDEHEAPEGSDDFDIESACSVQPLAGLALHTLTRRYEAGRKRIEQAARFGEFLSGRLGAALDEWRSMEGQAPGVQR
jgi:hypothetical protein